MESKSIDKDLSINQSIIQIQSNNKNSLSFFDIKSLSWQPKNEYLLNTKNISRSINENKSNSYLNISNKFNNSMEFHFLKNDKVIHRENSDSTNNYSEPSLSRYVDNDTLLKYESSRSELKMYKSKYDERKENNYFSNINNDYSIYKYRNASLLSFKSPSISRYDIKTISSSTASRNNNDVNPKNFNSIYFSNSNNMKYKHYHDFRNIKEKSDNSKTNTKVLNELNAVKSKYQHPKSFHTKNAKKNKIENLNN